MDILLNNMRIDNLRPMFYLVIPRETIHKTTEQVPDFTNNAIPWFVTLMILEFIYYHMRGQHHSESTNDSLTSMCAGMFQAIIRWAVEVPIYHYLWSNYRLITVSWDSEVVWCICLITQDFAYYLAHRAMHEVHLLWATHQMHHSSEYYNLSTALRQSFIQNAATMWFWMPQALFIPTNIWLVHKHLNIIYQFWIHSEAIPKLGPLEFVLNTPSHHRVHHGKNPYCIDKNYAGTLIIWDRLCGTFEEERDEEPVAYGLVDNADSFNQFYLQLFYLKLVLWDKPLAVTGGWWNSLKSIVYPPGWYPPNSAVRFAWGWWRLNDTEDGIPPVEYPPKKYNPPLPSEWLRWYTILHFIVLLATYVTFAKDRDHMVLGKFILYVAFMFATMQCFSAIFDRKWYADVLELLRSVSVYFYLLVVVRQPISEAPLVHMIWLGSAIAWATVIFKPLFIQKNVVAMSPSCREK